MKNTRLTFRVTTSLKASLEEVAEREGRSVAQVCESFLRAGLDQYGKRGSAFLQGIISKLKERDK